MICRSPIKDLLKSYIVYSSNKMFFTFPRNDTLIKLNLCKYKKRVRARLTRRMAYRMSIEKVDIY